VSRTLKKGTQDLDVGGGLPDASVVEYFSW
jgi:hypothetical protein